MKDRDFLEPWPSQAPLTPRPLFHTLLGSPSSLQGQEPVWRVSLGEDGEAEAAKQTLSWPGQPTAHQASALSCCSAGRGPGLLNHIYFNGHISLETAPHVQELIMPLLFQDSWKPSYPRLPGLSVESPGERKLISVPRSGPWKQHSTATLAVHAVVCLPQVCMQRTPYTHWADAQHSGQY